MSRKSSATRAGGGNWLALFVWSEGAVRDALDQETRVTILQKLPACLDWGTREPDRRLAEIRDGLECCAHVR